MATVNRPPFWVPRPGYDDPWQFDNNQKSSAVIQILSSQKIFGAGGQVVTRKYAPLYTENDPPPWLWKSPPSGAITVTQTQVKFYGQPGQSPTKNYAPYLTYNELPYWVGPIAEWMNSGAIRVTNTQAKFFGQPGQVPSNKQWPLYFSYNDPSTWYPSAESLDSEAILRAALSPFMFEPQWPYRYDESPMWQGTPVDSGAIQVTTTQVKFFGQPGQSPTEKYAPYLTINELPTWQKTASSSPLQLLVAIPGLPMAPFYFSGISDPPTWYPSLENLNSPYPLLPTGANPFLPYVRPAPYDETASWQWLSDPSASIIQILTGGVKLYGQGGQAAPFRPNFTYDDSSTWQWPQAERNRNVLFSATAPLAYPPRQWYSEDAFWQGAPMRSGAIQATTTQVRFYGQPGQAVPFRWNHILDDASTWQWPLYGYNPNVLVSSANLPRAPFYAPRPASDEVWIKFSAGISTVRLPIVQSPLVYPPRQWYSEDAFWLGSPSSSRAIVVTTTQGKFFGQPGQVVPFRWNYTTNDASTWQWPLYERNVNVLQPTVSPFIIRGWRWSDDPSIWQSYSLPSVTITLSSFGLYKPGVSFSLPPDDPPMWLGRSGGKNPNLVQAASPLVHPLPVFYSEDAFWQGSSARSYSITLTTTQSKFFGQPGQAPPFRPNFTGNDPSVWTWPGTTRNRNVLFPATSPLVYPPRQWYSEDALWQGNPVQSRVIVATTTQGKFYGQPGQVPPFRPNWTNNDPPAWRWTTPNAAIIRLLTATQLPGLAPGAVPARFYKFNYDDASTWWPKNRLVATLIFSILVPPPPAAANVVSARTAVGRMPSSTMIGEPRSRTIVGAGLSRTIVGGTEV